MAGRSVGHVSVGFHRLTNIMIPKKPEKNAIQKAMGQARITPKNKHQNRCRCFLAAATCQGDVPPVETEQAEYVHIRRIGRIIFHDYALSKKDCIVMLKEMCRKRCFSFDWIKKVEKIVDDVMQCSSGRPRGWRRGLAERCDDVMEGDYHPGHRKFLFDRTRIQPIAETFLNEYHAHHGQRTLHYYGGQFYRWEGNRYSVYDKDELKSEMLRFLTYEAMYRKVTPGFEYRLYSQDEKIEFVDFPAGDRIVREVLSAIQGIVRLPSGTSPNSWIGKGDPPCDPKTVIFGPTKIYDWHVRMFRAHHPGWFNLTCLPFDVDFKAPRARRFQRFLKELFGNDVEAVVCLEEYLGLLLTSITELQKMLLIVGPKRSGKGTLVRLITALLGQENVTSPRTTDFTSRFGLQDMIGKNMAVVSDARFGGSDIQRAIEVMLNITGEDSITIDRKFKEPVTLRLPTRIMILSNEEPRLPDASGAIVSRFVALRLTNSFYGQEDINLEAKLREELPGILKILVKSLQRLMRRGSFIQPESGKSTLSEMSKLANPIEAFVEEKCLIESGLRCTIGVLYTEWSNWCSANGQRPGPRNIFCRNLRTAFPSLAKRDGGAENFYDGIALRGQTKARNTPDSLTEK